MASASLVILTFPPHSTPLTSVGPHPPKTPCPQYSVLTPVLSSGFIYQHFLKCYFKKDDTLIFVLPSFLSTEYFLPNIYL